MKRRGWIIGRTSSLVATLIAFTVVLVVPMWAGAMVPPPEEEKARSRDESDRGPRAGSRRPADLRDRDRFRDEGRRRSRGDRGSGDRARDGSRRGREGGWGSGEFDPRRDEMSPRMIDRVMNLLREEVPEWYGRLADMEERRPERFRRVMRRVQPVVREYTSLRDKHPELAETILEEFRIEGRLRSMGREFREARGNESRQAEIEQDVAQLVKRQFEFKMRRRLARMKDIERRLTRERERFERDKASLSRQVQDKVRQITRGNPEDSLRDRDGERRRERRDAFGDRPQRRPQRRR